MADLTREELAAVRRAGDLLSEQFTNRGRPTVTRRLGSVTAVAQDGSASVLLDGDEAATAGVRLVASCASVAVGDRVVVDSYLNMSIVTGVLAWSLDSGLGTATPSSDGLMSASDKAKLDGIQARANYYTLPAATASARGGVRVGSGLRVSGDVLSVDNGAYVKALWTGSSAGSVTLSESVAGYRALVATIAGTDGVREASTLVWSPNGATFDVGIAFVAGSNGWRSMRMRYRASGTSLTCLLNERYTGTATVAGELRLVSVVGIR